MRGKPLASTNIACIELVEYVLCTMVDNAVLLGMVLLQVGSCSLGEGVPAFRGMEQELFRHAAPVTMICLGDVPDGLIGITVNIIGNLGRWHLFAIVRAGKSARLDMFIGVCLDVFILWLGLRFSLCRILFNLCATSFSSLACILHRELIFMLVYIAIGLVHEFLTGICRVEYKALAPVVIIATVESGRLDDRQTLSYALAIRVRLKSLARTVILLRGEVLHAVCTDARRHAVVLHQVEQLVDILDVAEISLTARIGFRLFAVALVGVLVNDKKRART